MEDQVLRYGTQFVTITAASLVLAEWGTPNFLREKTVRPKMVTALIYALTLNSLGYVADLVKLPGEKWWENLAALLLLSIVSMATASGLVMAKKKLIDKEK